MLNTGHFSVGYCHSHIFFFISNVFCLCHYFCVSSHITFRWKFKCDAFFIVCFLSFTCLTFGSLPNRDFGLQKCVMLCARRLVYTWKLSNRTGCLIDSDVLLFSCILVCGVNYERQLMEIWKRATNEQIFNSNINDVSFLHRWFKVEKATKLTHKHTHTAQWERPIIVNYFDFYGFIDPFYIYKFRVFWFSARVRCTCMNSIDWLFHQ